MLAGVGGSAVHRPQLPLAGLALAVSIPLVTCRLSKVRCESCKTFGDKAILPPDWLLLLLDGGCVPLMVSDTFGRALCVSAGVTKRFLRVRMLLSALAAVLYQTERLSSLALCVQRRAYTSRPDTDAAYPSSSMRTTSRAILSDTCPPAQIRTVTPTPLTNLPTPTPLPRRAITFGAIAWQ